MAAVANLYLKKEVLATILKTLEAKGENGVSLTISINDEPNKYDQNVSAYVNQSKEDREAQKPKYYVGNGSVVWNDGKIVTVKKKEAPAATPIDTSTDDLPF